MGDLAPNSILLGGPTPIGSRRVRPEHGTVEWYAPAADGGLHVWWRTDRVEPADDGPLLRVYVYMGSAD